MSVSKYYPRQPMHGGGNLVNLCYVSRGMGVKWVKGFKQQK